MNNNYIYIIVYVTMMTGFLKAYNSASRLLLDNYRGISVGVGEHYNSKCPDL